jgi:hypothetical protein
MMANTDFTIPFLTSEEADRFLENFPPVNTPSLDSTTDELTPSDKSAATTPNVTEEDVEDRITEVRKTFLNIHFKCREFPAFCITLCSSISCLDSYLTNLLTTTADVCVESSRVPETLIRCLDFLRTSCDEYIDAHLRLYARYMG